MIGMIYFSFLLLPTIIALGEHPIVRCNNGLVRGAKNETVVGNVTFYSFVGIPYAQPPTGNLRFRSPLPPSNWSGVLDGTTEMSICAQFHRNATIGTEDCLYINVYTPALPDDASNTYMYPNLPVMVWIHGGYFLQGSGNFDSYGPDYLLAENVVYVSFNYRLGIFGFLSTQDEFAPGNYGLKDQILALHWVQANIKAFGGDPDNVTVFGESAGSASISYLSQSPQSNGLFRNAIMQSGTTLCLWAYSRSPRNTAFAVGLLSGIFTTDSAKLVNRLRDVDYRFLNSVATGSSLTGSFFEATVENGTAYQDTVPIRKFRQFINVSEKIALGLSRKPGISLFLQQNVLLSQDIIHRSEQVVVGKSKTAGGVKHFISAFPTRFSLSNESRKAIAVNNPLAGFIFAPAAEPESEDAVFTGRSHEVLKQQKSINSATYLVGLNSLEGKFFANLLNLLRMYLLTFDVLPTRLVPVDMNVASKETERTVAMQLQKEYFPNELVTFSDKNLLKFLSDDQFVRPIAEYIRLLSQARNCYMYLFTYEGDLGGDDRSNNGVAHAEDVHYIFRTFRDAMNKSETDLKVRRSMIRLWTNFAKYGNPTPESDSLLNEVTVPLTSIHNNFTYVSIGENLSINHNAFEKTVEFYNNLYALYGNPPFDTY